MCDEGKMSTVRFMFGSKLGCGRVFPMGPLSVFNKSTISLMNLLAAIHMFPVVLFCGFGVLSADVFCSLS